MKEFNEQSYEEMLEKLFKRFLSFQNSGTSAYKPGLDNVLFLDSLMGHPHKKYRSIHVAGTNGKGSVCNMLSACLAAKGLKVGLYTSPHLVDFRERARIVTNDGPVLISREEVWSFIQTWSDTFDHLGTSFFEITTMMAFDWFARRGVDIAVIETGLGGRLDSTNIITPELSIITNIGLDHCDLLGNTIPEIAFEKAGIIKPGASVVIGESDPLTIPVFENKVLYTNRPLANSPGMQDVLTYADKVTPSLWEERGRILSEMDLQGPCQKKNLRTVLAALDVLGIEPDADAIIHTARMAGFHGRWEKLLDNPLTICDIGHNAHGLVLNFERLSGMDCTELIIVYGSVSDKDVDSVLDLIPPEATVVFTNASSLRAMPADELFRRFSSTRPGQQAYSRSSVATALELAFELASKTASPLLYVGGSTYVVAEAMAFLNDRK